MVMFAWRGHGRNPQLFSQVWIHSFGPGSPRRRLYVLLIWQQRRFDVSDVRLVYSTEASSACVVVCVCSVLPGPEKWSRLPFQHQGVFKRMLVLESGGKFHRVASTNVPCVNEGWSVSDMSFLSVWVKPGLGCAVICLSCRHMFFSYVPVEVSHISGLAVSHCPWLDRGQGDIWPLDRGQGDTWPWCLVSLFAGGFCSLFSSLWFAFVSFLSNALVPWHQFISLPAG